MEKEIKIRDSGIWAIVLAIWFTVLFLISGLDNIDRTLNKIAKNCHHIPQEIK